MNQTSQTKCPECRRPVTAGPDTHSVTHVAGTGTKSIHRRMTSTWHGQCWAEAEASVAESRTLAEADHSATLRAMREALGVPATDGAGVSA